MKMVIEPDTPRNVKKVRNKQKKNNTIALIYLVDLTMGCDLCSEFAADASLPFMEVIIMDTIKEVLTNAWDLVTVTELLKTATVLNLSSIFFFYQQETRAHYQSHELLKCKLQKG